MHKEDWLDDKLPDQFANLPHYVPILDKGPSSVSHTQSRSESKRRAEELDGDGHGRATKKARAGGNPPAAQEANSREADHIDIYYSNSDVNED